MTKPKPIEELQRPRRKLTASIVSAVFCPACGHDAAMFAVRIVAYRRQAIRFECKECATRWTMSYADVDRAIKRRRLTSDEWAEVEAEVARLLADELATT
jgi:formate dehydrogenase maturation protein FdhE